MATARDKTRAFWDVVERSAGGHARRRRLAWRMTLEEALNWGKANGLAVVRAPDAAQSEDYVPPKRAQRA